MVDFLHERFQQTRVVHAAHCRTMADLPAVKADKAQLTKLADTMYNSTEGLKRLEQFEAGAIMTSLAVSTLPPTLKESWEQHTEDTKGVPDISELIRFVRRKAANLAGPVSTTDVYQRSRRSRSLNQRSRDTRSNAQLCTLLTLQLQLLLRPQP